MKLTRVERWRVSNQFKILEEVDPESAEYYAEMREAIDSGYLLEYPPDYVLRDEQTLSDDDCCEVLDILSMFRDLRYGYDELKDRSGLEEWLIELSGFDGNNEATRLGYCQYICNPKHERFQELHKGDNYNSHMPTLDAYRRMLAVWRRVSEGRMGRLLTKQQIVEIVSARPDPGSPMGQAMRERGTRH